MRLSLYRDVLTPQSTIGKLYADRSFLAFTLELPIKDGKPGSAIPAGIYPIELAPSPKFQVHAEQDPWWKPYCDAMPHIVGIPGRSLIMLHPGNYPTETEGCILVGETEGINSIGTSRLAFQKLYPLIQKNTQTPEGCEIQIFDPPVLLHPDLAAQQV